MHVPRLRCHVEVSAYDDFLSWVTLAVEITSQSSQPRELVDELLAADHAPIRYIDTDDPQAFDTGREEACRRLFFPVTELMDHLDNRRAREECYPIVTSLAVGGDVVARLLKDRPREGGVGDFGLLQTKDGRGVYR